MFNPATRHLPIAQWPRPDIEQLNALCEEVSTILNGTVPFSWTLIQKDILLCRKVGSARRSEARRRGVYNDSCTTLENDINGAGAECAYCRGRRVHWPAHINVGSKPDVGERTQIKQTPLSYGSLLFRPPEWSKHKRGDKDDHRFVLVIGEMPTFRIVGWIWGHEAREIGFSNLRRYRERNKGHDCDCLKIPQAMLHKDFDFID